MFEILFNELLPKKAAESTYSILLSCKLSFSKLTRLAKSDPLILLILLLNKSSSTRLFRSLNTPYSICSMELFCRDRVFKFKRSSNTPDLSNPIWLTSRPLEREAYNNFKIFQTSIFKNNQEKT